MIYKDFKGLSLPTLGFGCMRLPGGRNNAEIDIKATEEMVEYAMQNGANYFDTAWGYHAGKSEPVMGSVLKKYDRSSFFLASKFPGFNTENFDKGEEIFNKQLERCQTDYFDFYLLHNVCDSSIDLYLDDEKHGVISYLIAQKKAGRIRHLGFSTHGCLETIKRLIDAYGEHIEFCQIQLNYIDWTFQEAKEKVELLKERNIPIWVMEPVRGGTLATMEEKYTKILSAYRPQTSAVEWAFRFIQSIPEVAVTLSGMSNLEQVKDNIRIFSENVPLNNEEFSAILSVADKMLEKKTLACTSCKYCVTNCPSELDIPKLIDIYNDYFLSGKTVVSTDILKDIPEDKRPSDCIGCKSCESACPQDIKISEMMANFAEHIK